MEKCELKKDYCDNKDVKLIRLKSDRNVYDGDLKYACKECRKFINGGFKLINNTPMPETKKKVDVADIMKRANEKKEAVKASTEKIQGKTNNFRILPGFSKYEFNGIILRNVATKAIIKFKTGRTKYQINDDKGKSHNLSTIEIGLMLPCPPQEIKDPKSPRVTKEKVIKVKKESTVDKTKVDSLKAYVADLSKKEIVSGEYKDHRKHYMLHLKGCPVSEINELTKKPIPSIKRDIWRYETGKTVL